MTHQALSSYRERLDEILSLLKKQGSLVTLLVDLTQLNQVERDYGSATYEKVLHAVHMLIVGLQGSSIRTEDILVTADKGSDACLIFPVPGRNGKPMTSAQLRIVASRVEESTNRLLAQLASPFLPRYPKVRVGFATAVENPLVMPERIVMRLVESAWEWVRFEKTQRRFQRRFDLQDIMAQDELRTVHQPIVDIKTKETLGYEALTRGPADSPYVSPGSLFGTAVECDVVFELDRFCRRVALRNSKGLPSSILLFVNVMPAAVYDPDFRGDQLIELLEPLKLTPDQIVLELTEKEAIENYSLFVEAVQSFTQMGFSIAIDDIGAGYSGLEKVAKLKPKFLKLDISMVSHIDTSTVRREMVQAFKTFADKIDSKIIAEGIERREELKTLVELGIHLGQGYLLGRPEPLFVEKPRTRQAKGRQGRSKHRLVS